MNTMAFTADDAFANVDAQDFAFALPTRGPELILDVVDQRRASSVAQSRRVLAACETVAAANGHPPGEQVWCAVIEEWLLESDYMPDQATVDRCAGANRGDHRQNRHGG